MQNHTTASGILDDLSNQLEKSKRTGDKVIARCPAHEDTNPSLSATIGRDGDRVILKCFAGCTTEDVTAALGWTMGDLFVSDGNRPPSWAPRQVHVLDPSKLPGAPKPLPKGWGANDWDIPKGVNVLEALRGAAIPVDARAIGDEADAVALETLPDEVPDAVRKMILAIQKAETDDKPHEARLRVLRTIAASDEWAGFDLVIRCAVFDAVRGAGHLMATAVLGRFDVRRATWIEPPAPDVEPHEAFKSIWDYSATDAPVALIPGLAWSGMVSMISSAPKLGKTSLIANGIAAWLGGRDFLGEPCGPSGRVLYVSETPVGLLQSWLTRYGCPADAPIVAGGVARSATIVLAAGEAAPDLIVIDSITDLFSASAGGSMWNAGDVRRLIQPLRALGCAVVLVHHVRKSDGMARDSSDLTALTDQNVTFDPGYAFGGGDPPPGARRLGYFGRWTEPTRMLAFTEAEGYSLDGSTPGGGTTGGGADPFYLGVPRAPLDGRVTDYLMQHPEASGRHIRAALGCHQRDLRPALDRLVRGGDIESHKGLRGAVLWTVTSTGPEAGISIFEPVGPVPVH